MNEPVVRRAALVLCLCAVTLLWVSCSGPVVTAVGDANDIVVITAGPNSVAAGALPAIMESEVTWLLGEGMFDVALTTARESGDLKNIRHVLVAGTWDENDVVGLARTAVPGLRRGDPVRLRIVDDVWARKQVVGVILADTEQQLKAFLDREHASLAIAFEEAAVRHLADGLRATAVEAGMATALEDRFGWSIAPPSGYDFYTTSAGEGFVFFRRTRPDRSVFVYWTDGVPEHVSEQFVIERRDDLTGRYYDGDAIELRRPLERDHLEFLGRPGIRVSGWWANKELVGGGPFRTYCFHDSSQDRIYIVDVSLFAPSYDKTSMMRNLDAIAHTFTPAPATAPATGRA